MRNLGLLVTFMTFAFSCATVQGAPRPDGTAGPGDAPALGPTTAVTAANETLTLKPLWKKGDVQKFWIVQNLKVTNGTSVLLDSEKSETGVFTILDSGAAGFKIQWLDLEIQQVRGAKNPLENKIANALENTKILLGANEKGQINKLENYPELKTTADENLKRLAAIIGTTPRVQTLMTQFKDRLATQDLAFDTVGQFPRVLFSFMGIPVNTGIQTSVDSLLPRVHSGGLNSGKSQITVKFYNKETGDMVLELTQTLERDAAAAWMVDTLAEVAKNTKTAAPDAQGIKKDFNLADKATFQLNFKTGKVSKAALERVFTSGTYVQREALSLELIAKK